MQETRGARAAAAPGRGRSGRRARASAPRSAGVPGPLRESRATGWAWLRNARGRFKGAWGSLLVPESPRGSGSWDVASTLQSDRSYSFTMFAVKWEDRRTGGCVFLAPPGRRLSEHLKMKRVRTAVQISGSGVRSAFESWLHPLTCDLPELIAQAL